MWLAKLLNCQRCSCNIKAHLLLFAEQWAPAVHWRCNYQNRLVVSMAYSCNSIVKIQATAGPKGKSVHKVWHCCTQIQLIVVLFSASVNHFTSRTTIFVIQKFYILLTHCIYVFCVDLRTNSDYFNTQNLLIYFYNRDEVCLLRGTDWMFNCTSRQFQLLAAEDGFDSRLACVKCLVDKVALGKFSLPALQIALSVSFHQCSILIHPSTTHAV